MAYVACGSWGSDCSDRDGGAHLCTNNKKTCTGHSCSCGDSE